MAAIVHVRVILCSMSYMRCVLLGGGGLPPAAGGGSDIGVGDAGSASSASAFVQAFSSFRPRASSRVAAAPQRLVPEGGARNTAAEAPEAKSFHFGAF